MGQDSLQLVPIGKWPELQTVLLADWPRSLPGYNALEVQARYKKQGFDYGFNVYSLYGDFSNGYIAINEKVNNFELIIQYPKDDTETLDKALRETKRIDWSIRITLAFTAPHVMDVIQKILKEKSVLLDLIVPTSTFIFEKGSPLLDVSLPPGYTFEVLKSSEYVDLINEKWPHRYPHSEWYFHLLTDTKSGYGLFKDGKLACWIFIGDCGHLTHLYTLEEYRKQGLATLTLKLISNELLSTKRQVFAFCVAGNDNAYRMYKKLGFKETNLVVWGFVNNTSSSQN